MSSIEERAWAAGLFDGEGCISISCVSPSERNDLANCSYRLVTKVTMGCRDTIIRFSEIIGTGSVQNHVGESEFMNSSTSWVAQSRKSELALITIFPYLVTKKEEAIIALEFMKLPDPSRGGKNGSSKIDRNLLMIKHDFYEKMAKIKPRFRFRKSPLKKFIYKS